MNILKWILAVLAALLVITAAGGYWFLNSSKPRYRGELSLEGLSHEVQVYFDRFGIPHIYAENEEDLYFALGYVHAQERLFQMELLRRVGGGRLSEIFGPELVETDKFLRTIGINHLAERSAEIYLSDNTEPFQKAALSYLQGINTFIHHGPTPIEFTLLGIPKEEFTPVDIFRVVGYMGFNFNTAVRTDPLLTVIAAKLGADYLNDLVINTTSDNTTIPTFMSDTSAISNIVQTSLGLLDFVLVPQWMASNSWVVGPGKSRSGFPILANDAHIGFSQPAVWYEAHLTCPGFNFYGNHLAGFPFGLVGHNDFSAWGITIFPNDDMDFYREKVDPGNRNMVWSTDYWEKLQTRKEVISIKGAEDLVFEVKSSRHGPIINEVNQVIDSIESQPVSFYWTYLRFPCKALQTAYGMAHSQSMEEFSEAISLLEAPGLNITYADREGNIAWWAVARLIKRPGHVEPKLILDGASGEDEPLGWFSFDENPRSINPPEGIVYSANNQPDSALGIFHPGYYFPGSRGQRIMELLTSKNDWDLEGFKEMILDDQSPVYPRTCRLITSLLTPHITEVESEAVEILNTWDGSHGAKETGPVIFYKLINRIQENTFMDELGRKNYDVYATTQVARRTIDYLIDNDSSRWWDNINTPELEDRRQVINKSFRETVLELSKEFGEDPNLWYWDKTHLLEHVHAIGRQKPFNHLFNVGPFPVAGGDEVINKMDFNKTTTPYKVKSGPSMRVLIDLVDMEHSLSILPTGQSGHVMSPHYRDQAELYLAGKFRPQQMNEEIIISESKGVLILKPGLGALEH